MVYTFISISLLVPCLVSSEISQTDSLRQEIAQIIRARKAEIGVAINGFESHDTLSFSGNNHFPMQSVYKFHIALTVLNEIDRKKLSYDRKIHIKKKDLLPDTWSPLKKEHPDGNVDLPLNEILRYTISFSDNNGCDILLRLLGGPKKVDDYMHRIGISDVSVKANEADMHKDWNVQYTNWTTPLASLQLLDKFYKKEILSDTSFDFLWRIMTETSTGGNRIKGELPQGTSVAHKTGSSGKNKAGVTAALNDIGIVTLPDGTHFALCVFVSNSTENDETNEKIIADIAKAAWNFFTTK